MRNRLFVMFAFVMAFGMIAAPIYYARSKDREHRNFHVVEEGVLYRSGQLSLPQLQKIVAAHGIRTVISLREERKDSFDEQEEIWVKAKALNFVRIPYRNWHPDATGKIPAEESVKTFREIMDKPANHPVLVHCYAGIHRTGMMCAIFRMDFQGWKNTEAMAEMRTLGYTMLDDHQDIVSYLTKYQSPDSAKPTPFLSVSRPRP